MSYEIHLLRVERGESPRAAFERYTRQQSEELNPGPVVPEKEAEKLRLAKALLRFNEALALAEFDFEGVARIQGCDETEARLRYRHLELNSEDYTGIQITLWDDAADISFPYWHNGEQALAVLRQAWQYLDVLSKWGGFVAFDPQLDRAINLENDFANVWQVYSGDNCIALENVSA